MKNSLEVGLSNVTFFYFILILIFAFPALWEKLCSVDCQVSCMLSCHGLCCIHAYFRKHRSLDFFFFFKHECIRCRFLVITLISFKCWLVCSFLDLRLLHCLPLYIFLKIMIAGVFILVASIFLIHLLTTCLKMIAGSLFTLKFSILNTCYSRRFLI